MSPARSSVGRLLRDGGVFLCVTLLLPAQTAAPTAAEPASATAQNAVNRTPTVTFHSGFARGEFVPGSVSRPDFADAPRVDSLIRAGNLYLSLQDAITLALENNLDLELERYSVQMSVADLLRAQGGGQLRGIPLTVYEAPTGLGGPGQNPLVTTAASGSLSQTIVSSAINDAQLIAEGQADLGITGSASLSAGTAIPQFDPAITTQIFAEHNSTLEASLNTTGTPYLSTSAIGGNIAFTQAFAPGTFVSAGFQSQYFNQNSIFNAFQPYTTSTFGVTITQPLLRSFGRDLNTRFIRIAKNNQKISDYVFQQQVISTVYGITRLYDDLVSLIEDAKVKQETFATAQRLYEDNANKVEQGTLAPIEATRAQAQVAAAQQDVINSQGFVRQQEIILKNVLSSSWAEDSVLHEARIVPTDALELDPLPMGTPAEIETAALNYRPEYQAAKLQLTNSEISLKGSRNELLPELDVVGTVQNSGLAGQLNPNVPAALGQQGINAGFGSTLAQIFRRDYPSATIGLNLTLPVRNRIAQSDLVRDELQVRQTEVRLKQLENRIRAEVEDALIALERSRTAYEAAVQTTKLQTESLQIEQEKFDVGLSTSFLVIQYQDLLAQARSTEVAALDAYAKAKAQYERAAGLALTNHNIQIDQAYKGQRPAQ